MNDTHKRTLRELFPSMDDGLIEAVYMAKGKDVETTTAALLNMNSTEITADEKARARRNDLELVTDAVMKMPRDPVAKRLAGTHGLHITTVCYEDSARTKGSVWGPCISDLTLNVDDRALPIIRHPNFEDLTWDVPLAKIPLVVGNEVGSGELYTVTLEEYLSHFKMYLNDPSGWTGTKTSLLAPEKDTHAVMSAQACFLPVPKSGEAKFNVSIFNYQSRADDPAVLAIVSTAQGTSAQIVTGARDSWSGQKLFFNRNGERASFIGQRLSDDRAARGISSDGPMTKAEKANNMIMIIQVPLKQRASPRRMGFGAGGGLPGFGAACDDFAIAESCSAYACPPCAPARASGLRSVKRRERADVEEAIVRVGEAEGAFTECGRLPLERDERFPVRVTLQFYKSTANGIIDEESVSAIAKQIETSRTHADSVGSLVVGEDTHSRPTTHTPVAPALRVPAWWSTFWLTYRSLIRGYDEEGAKRRLFGDGRFEGLTLDESKTCALALLGTTTGGIDRSAPVEFTDIVGVVHGVR